MQQNATILISRENMQQTGLRYEIEKNANRDSYDENYSDSYNVKV